MIYDSFAEYQEGQFDDLWDEYLDWLGLYDRAVNVDSLEDWLGWRDDVSERAEGLMRDYVIYAHDA